MKINCLFSALLTLTLFSASHTFAQQEQEDIDLYRFCAKFPQNSKCEGIESPVALDDREGALIKCQLRWEIQDKLSKCKYKVNNKQLSIYYEIGTETPILDNRKPTKEITVTAENMMFFPTVKRPKWTGKLFGKERILLNIDIFFRVESDSKVSNRSNRLSIYFQKEAYKDEELEQAKRLLLTFLGSLQKLNKDQQSISNQIAYLQPVNSSPKDKAQQVNQLLNSKQCVRCDLSGVDLTGADLQNANLEGANLQNAILTDAKLNRAYLLGANLQNTTLTGASLIAAELPYGLLTKANLSGANLSNASLQGTIFNQANLTDAQLSGGDLSSQKVNIGSSKRTFPAYLLEANLTNADLSNAKLNRAHLTKANLENANLSNSNLKLAQLGNANLANTDLANTNFDKAYLVNANLSNAKLNNTRITKVNMNGINLSGVDINSADLQGSTLCKATMPDGSISEEGCE